jgi:hypothetical protein
MRRQSAHVDADVLAELSAGLIGGRRATRIHTHLAGCERCAGVMAQLSAVSVLLAAVPSPAMPEWVTGRLASALTDEAAARSGTAATPARPTGHRAFHHDPERGRGAPSRSAGRGFRGPAAARAFAAAAAACVLAAGGYTVMQLTQHGPSATPRPPRAGGRAQLTPGYGPNQHAPKVGLITPPPTGTSSAPPGTVLPTFTVIRSGTNFQSAHLAAQIESALAKAGKGAAAVGGAEHVSSTTEEDCVYRVTGGTRPTLVDEARYDGRPATVIALAGSGAQLGQAWVVGPRCSADNSDKIMRVELPSSGG